MGNDQKYSRITITLPPDLAAWLKQKQAELESKDRRLTTSVSAIVADAVAEMKARDEAATRGQAMPDIILNDPTPPLPHTGATARIVVPSSETSVGGSSTRRKVSYRTAGKAK